MHNILRCIHLRVSAFHKKVFKTENVIFAVSGDINKKKFTFKLNVLFNYTTHIKGRDGVQKTEKNLWSRELDICMEDLPKKKHTSTEIDLSKISSIKRVSDLFPVGITRQTTTQDLPNETLRVISESSITKNIPNLVNSRLSPIPGNSISSQAMEQNYQLQKDAKNQLQHTFIKRIRPLNVLTLILILGWAITIVLLNIL